MRTSYKAVQPSAEHIATAPAGYILDQALGWIASLAQAKWSDKFLFDRETLDLYRGDGFGESVVPSGRLFNRVAAALVARGAFFSQDRITWLPEEAGGDTILLIEAARHDRFVHVIVLGLSGPLSACQRRLGDTLTPLAALTALFVQHEVRQQGVHQHQLAATAALDSLDYGLVAVRSDHTPLLMNRAVRTMLAPDGPIQISRGRIRLRSQQDSIRFHVALDSIVAAKAGRRHEPADALMMLLGGAKGEAEDQDKTVLLIAPAHDMQAGGGVPHEAMALIYIFRPEISDVRGLEPLCVLLGLSRAETRLVTQLLTGHNVAESAAAMRIKLETARTYLKHIFAKTGTHRQADLVALLYRYLLTIRGRFAFRPI